MGSADGICCRSQKLLPGTVNGEVRLWIQWWDLHKSKEKGRRGGLDPSVRKAFNFQSGWQGDERALYGVKTYTKKISAGLNVL